MPGTRARGFKARETNKQRHGDDFYKKISSQGGKKSRGGGFAANPELARAAGRKGGSVTADQRKKNLELLHTYTVSEAIEGERLERHRDSRLDRLMKRLGR